MRSAAGSRSDTVAFYHPALTPETPTARAPIQRARDRRARDAMSAALAGKGIPAAAVTAPIFVDFDGGGYRAPFAP